MKSFRILAALAALGYSSACRDSSAAPVVPAAIAVAAGDQQSATVGQRVAVAPTFLVTDANGRPLEGVPFTVAVTAGGGVVTGAPRATLAGPTPVGEWTLGPSVGTQTLTVSVQGLSPLVVNAHAAPGAPAHLVALTPPNLSARVGDLVAPAPSARVVDAFNNPIAGAAVTVVLLGGGQASATLTSDGAGVVTVADWRLGTVAGQNALTLTAGAASTSFLATASPGDPAKLLIDGVPTSAPAGAVMSGLIARVVDAYGNIVSGQTAALAVTAGGGSLAATPPAARGDGAVALPSWTLGRSAVPQSARVTAGALAADVLIPIGTSFNIDVRFFGDAMTDVQRSWFTNAAARISGAVTGDVPDAVVSNLDVSSVCGVPGLPVLDGAIDDLVVYASVSPIDGQGKILAMAGPCVLRNPQSGGYTVIGVMLFDSADMDRMARDNLTQDVITHEMLHVVGVGTMWEDKGLLTGVGTSGVAFWGKGGVQGCAAAGGAAPCAASVPVENNGVPGTTDSHWRESVFGNELMTGYANVGGMPFSEMTIGSLGDLGYEVNLLAADPFRLPGSGGALGNRIPGRGVTEDWEKRIPPGAVLGASPADRPTFIRRLR